MAAYNKFNVFTQDLVQGSHNFASGGATYKVALTNVAPVATNAVFGDLTEITAQNGYSAGGTASAMSDTTSSGTVKVLAVDVVFTAAGGSFGPLRYVVVYCSSQATPLKPLVSWFDYGSSITINTGETFTVDFDGSAGFFTVT